MEKQKGLLSRGLFNRKFMDSKITTRSITRKESILGHLIGPLGLIMIVNTIAALVEKFYTQQVGLMYGLSNLPMVQQMGDKYLTIMTFAKILAIGLGVLNGFLIQKSKSRQGRLRPWYLIFGFITIIIGFGIFLFPGTALGENYWYYFFTLLIAYHTVGSVYFYLFRDIIVSVSTRDAKEKARLKFIRQLSWTLISGILIGMILTTVVLPKWLEHDINGYAYLMIGLSIAGIPLLLMEYFYTRERVTEDVAQEVGIGKQSDIPLKTQMKALLTNKYFIILMILSTMWGIIDNFKGGNVQYFYVKFLLGGEHNDNMYMLYSVITGLSTGVGIFAIWPLAKRFGIRNVAWFGYLLSFISGIIGWIFADNLIVALVSGLMRETGMIPQAYIIGTLLYYAYDDIEFRSHVRLEGLIGPGIIVAVQSAIWAPFTGGFEGIILRMGFVDQVGVTVSPEVRKFIALSFYMFNIIGTGLYVLLLPFVDVEKKLPLINEELINRQRLAAEARGEVWIHPDELEKLELAEISAETERNRLLDLQEYCDSKGLDFEVENQKYLAKKALKEQKWLDKQARKKAKKAANEKKNS